MPKRGVIEQFSYQSSNDKSRSIYDQATVCIWIIDPQACQRPFPSVLTEYGSLQSVDEEIKLQHATAW